MKKLQGRLFIITTIIVFVISLVSTVTVFADDATPPPPTDVPAVEETPPTEIPAEEEPLPTEIPAVEETPTADIPTVQEALPAEGPASEKSPAVEEQPTLPEMLEAAPEGTNLVVLDENGEILPLVSVAAAEVLAAPDPYFTVGTVLYTFTSADCDPVTALAQPCSNPIQASINFLNGTTASSPWFGTGATPDDDGFGNHNIYVEGGIFSENVTLNGSTGWNLGTNTPLSLGLIGADSDSTMLIGWFNIQDMYDFTLSGFSVVNADPMNSAVRIFDTEGTLQLTDLDVTSSSSGIDIETMDPLDITLSDIDVTTGGYGIIAYADGGGDVILDDVSSTGNSDVGADVWTSDGDIIITNSDFNDNRVGLDAETYDGSITITDSDFSDNVDLGVYALSVTSGITLNRVTATGNGWAGAYIESYSDDGAILVQDSNFSDNVDFGLYTLSHSTSGTFDVTLNQVTATGNSSYGAVIDVLSGSPDPQVLCGQFTGNDGYGLWLYLDTGVNAYLGGPDLSGNALGEYDLDYGTVTFGQCGTAGGGGGGEGGGGNSKANPQNVSAPTVSCSGVARVVLQAGEAFGDYENLCGLALQLIEVTGEALPGTLPEGSSYLAGLKAEVTADGIVLDALPEGGRITLKFPFADTPDAPGRVVLFWNGAEWAEVPGGQVIDGFYVVTVTTPGTYVLVSK